MKAFVKSATSDEKGVALVLALILLLVGGLIAAGLLGHMGAGLLAGEVYDRRTAELYAADAGVEDALWQIQNEKLADLFPESEYQSRYNEYDYFTPWDYGLNNHDYQGGVAEIVLVNDKTVHVTIQNVWMPMGIDPPDAYTARQIIEEGKLMIVGSPALAGIKKYEIKISYDPCGGIPAVKTIGIWLPAGFEYDNNCSLEGEDYYSEPTVTLHKGGCAVVWSVSPPVSLAEFPSSFTFQYSGPEGQIPGAALSWMDTTWAGFVPGYTWDGDVKIYKISSTATDPNTGSQTAVESYTSTVELRKLGSAMSGDYYATGATLMTPTSTSTEGKRYRDRLFRESSATVAGSDIPSNAVVEAAYLYWSGWIEESPGDLTIFYEDCGNFDPPVMDWDNGSAWDIYSTYSDREFRGNAYEGPAGQWQLIWGPETCENFDPPVMDWDNGSAWDISSERFRGRADSDTGESARYVGVSSSINLSDYAGQTVRVSWQQAEEGAHLSNEDGLYFSFSGNGGSTWSSDYEAFRGDNPPSSFSYTIPNAYLTNNFRMRFYLDGFTGHGERCYIDNIEISAFVAPQSEPPGRYLTMSDSIDLSGYGGQTIEVSWQQDEDGYLEDSDRLYFAFSADGGSTWSSDYEAFRDDNPPSSFSYTIPNEYLTNDFRMRFYMDGFDDDINECCYIDDIMITAELPLVETAKVNRVMFGTSGNMKEITAELDDCQVAPTPDAVPGSWSYSCFYDVTDLELEEDSSVKAIIEEEMHSGGSGSVTFTLGHVLEGSGYNLHPSGTTAYPLATPALSHSTKYQWTYAGWSLLIIYSSPETKGHQLYLFDTFRYVGLHTQVTFSISNFLAPDDTTGSHLTYFVGEGDDHWTTDYIKINGYKLPRPGDPYEPYQDFNPQNNVFNSYSNSLDDPYLSGVDIDTFDVSNCIGPGDSSAEVILDNGEEIYDLVYIILSFRSLLTGGGVMGYLIR